MLSTSRSNIKPRTDITGLIGAGAYPPPATTVVDGRDSIPPKKPPATPAPKLSSRLLPPLLYDGELFDGNEVLGVIVLGLLGFMVELGAVGEMLVAFCVLVTPLLGFVGDMLLALGVLEIEDLEPELNPPLDLPSELIPFASAIAPNIKATANNTANIATHLFFICYSTATAIT